MPTDLSYLEGRKFCLVLVRLDDEKQPDGPLKLKCIHGRASVDVQGALRVHTPHESVCVPSSCYHRVLPNDGTAMLGDAEFFVLCRVAGMEL